MKLLPPNLDKRQFFAILFQVTVEKNMEFCELSQFDKSKTSHFKMDINNRVTLYHYGIAKFGQTATILLLFCDMLFSTNNLIKK